ncbi:MAG: GspH/FimT family pseudopilin [Acidobacteria bacterium]|nr:GspH/FimT family pseudopilin [Acidobacteriota bacterium]MBI3263594.1 GspH/FimT family pseudopilin [Acidobacteriota bacterium]
MTVLTSMAIPVGAGAIDEVNASTAARYLVTRFRLARLEAVKRSSAVGFRFQSHEGRYDLGCYADGNGDGLRARDIGRGVDPPIGNSERLGDRFRGVDFGFLPGVPAIDEPTGNGGGDPIRLGASDILSFNPLGSASSGTVYLRGRVQQQYAIRILGITGRVRLWRFDLSTRTWTPR